MKLSAFHFQRLPVNAPGFAMNFERPRQNALLIEIPAHPVVHRLEHLVQPGQDVLFIDTHDRHVVFQDDLVERFSPFRGEAAEGGHASVRMNGFSPDFRLLSLPLKEASAGGVIFQREDLHIPVADQMHSQSVDKGKVVFDPVPDDVLPADGEIHAVDGGRVSPCFVGKLLHELCVAGLGFLAEKAGDDGAVRPMAFSGAAQAPVKPGLDRLPPGQPFPGKRRQCFPEMSGDPDRGNGVRTGGARADLEKIAQRGLNDLCGRTGIAPDPGPSRKGGGGNSPRTRRNASQHDADPGGRNQRDLDEITSIHDNTSFKFLWKKAIPDMEALCAHYRIPEAVTGAIPPLLLLLAYFGKT